MARAPMVTRELIGTEAKVLMVDVEKAVTNYADITVQGNYKTAENLLKAIKKVYETPAFKIVLTLSALWTYFFQSCIQLSRYL